MGRGRKKAKQTKVARELKYHSFDTDLDKLQQELASERGDDQYADLAAKYADFDDEDEDDED
ncbi:MAG: DUF3073 domain-containing protein [Candidatus Nanopelagicales bacterium]|jgi:hypothetical protein